MLGPEAGSLWIWVKAQHHGREEGDVVLKRQGITKNQASPDIRLEPLFMSFWFGLTRFGFAITMVFILSSHTLSSASLRLYL